MSYLLFLSCFCILCSHALEQFYLDEGDTLHFQAYSTPYFVALTEDSETFSLSTLNASTFIWHYTTKATINLELKSKPGWYLGYEPSRTGVPVGVALVQKEEEDLAFDHLTCFFDTIEMWRDETVTFELCQRPGWFLYWNEEELTLDYNTTLETDEEFKDRISFIVHLDDHFTKFAMAEFPWWPIILAGSISMTIIIISVILMVRNQIPDAVIIGMITGILSLMGLGLFIGMVYGYVTGMIIGMFVGMFVGSIIGTSGGYLINKYVLAKKTETSYALM